ncbi:MAG: hypothetical protein ACRDLB_02590 [Actinomycetota bacterium]
MKRDYIVVLMLALGASCGNDRAAEDSREIIGLVVDIRTGTGFGEVESFTLKDGSEEFEIFVDPDATYDFPGIAAAWITPAPAQHARPIWNASDLVMPTTLSNLVESRTTIRGGQLRRLDGSPEVDRREGGCVPLGRS